MIIQQTGNTANAGSIVDQNATPAVKQESPVEQAKAQAAVQETQRQPSSKQLHNMVEQVNKTIQTLSSNHVQFTVDKETGKEIVKVVDRETEEVIRQIPSEEMVAIAKRLDELQGLIIRQKA